jgi:hypothetical protein
MNDKYSKKYSALIKELIINDGENGDIEYAAKKQKNSIKYLNLAYNEIDKAS